MQTVQGGFQEKPALHYIIAVSALYLTLRLLPLTGYNKEVLISIFIISTVAGFINRAPDHMVIYFPFIMAQHSFTSSFNRPVNWISTEIYFPISIIQLISVVLLCKLMYKLVVDSKTIFSRSQLLLTFLLLVSIFQADITSIPDFKTDLILLGTTVIYLYYTTQVLTEREKKRTQSMLILTPVGLAAGNIITYLIDPIINATMYNMYWVNHWYILSVLVVATIDRTTVTRVSRIVPIIFILHMALFINFLTQSSTGTMKLLITVSVLFLVVVKEELNGERNHLAVYSAMSILPVLLIYSIIYFFTDISLPLHDLTSKFYSVFTFEIERMNHSPAVRIIELLNIAKTLLMSGRFDIILGGGLGSYFMDNWYPFSNYLQLTPSDYSRAAIESGRFYSPHTEFGGYILLKYGLLGIGTFSYIFIYNIKEYVKSRTAYAVVPLIVIVQIPIFGFGIKNSILLGIALGLATKVNTSPHQ